MASISDIARLAGVSKSTVSRVLSDSPQIGEQTKARVRAILKEQNFHVNAAAQRLSRRQSRTIAFVIHAYHHSFSVADLFVLEILGSIFNELAEAGYDMLLVQADPADTAWARQYLATGRVDGFILLTSTRRQEHIRALIEAGAPFVAWGAPGGEPVCTVIGDNFTGGKLAAEHLLRSGRMRIAFLGGPAGELEVQQRLAGCQAALRTAGSEIHPARIIHQEYGAGTGAAGMRRLLAQAPDLDAVFATSDMMAIEAINAIHALGRRVPEDVAVVGYDDLSIAALSRPPLTTVRQNIPLAGKLLVQTLLHALQGGEITSATLPVEIIVRQSA